MNIWRIPRSIILAVAISLALWVCMATVAFGQDIPLRHYRRADLQEDPGGQIRSEQHLMVATDGRAAVVFMSGWEGAPAPELTAAASGPFYFDGDNTLCFVPDDYEGSPELRSEVMSGRTFCFVYDEDTDTFTPINRPDMPLENCGEPHGLSVPNPNARGT